MTSKEGNKDLWLAQSVLLEAEPTLMLYYLITVEPSTASKVKASSGLSLQNGEESAGRHMATSWPFCKQEPKMFMSGGNAWVTFDPAQTLPPGSGKDAALSFLRISGLHTHQARTSPLSILNQFEESKQPLSSVRWRESQSQKKLLPFTPKTSFPVVCVWCLPFAGAKQRQTVADLYPLSLPSD